MISQSDFVVIENRRLGKTYALLIVRPSEGLLPEMLPGQFVQVQVPEEAGVLLRRPISICNVDQVSGTLWLLVRDAGRGTHALVTVREGETLNMILPLGNGFSAAERDVERALLVGGGVGVAPLLYLGRTLQSRGIEVNFLLGARSKTDLLMLDEFKKCGEVALTTDDGSAGVHGVVTAHPILHSGIPYWACCGPMPMMRAVAAMARECDVTCEVSLENMMACGLGACLCCVEDTVDAGNVCVCKEGPVFNINRLRWD